MKLRSSLERNKQLFLFYKSAMSVVVINIPELSNLSISSSNDVVGATKKGSDLFLE